MIVRSPRQRSTSLARILLSACLALVPPAFLRAQTGVSSLPPKREVRAVWITTVQGQDWPPSTDPARQQESLHAIVRNLAAGHFNTIFFQVRGRTDAMYRSRFEPWSPQLTGVLGQDPGWDPLDTIIEDAHRHGMELHAWFNAFLARNNTKAAASGSPGIVEQHPGWFHQIEGEWWFDPGIPAVRAYIIRVAMDLVRHYDIDGLQFDFIRYPNRPFPDDAAYRQYGEGLPRDDWRRENINKLVRAMYDSAVACKPMLKIGSTPIGIYLNVGRIKGLQGYEDLAQDSRRWLREGKQDYIAPQVYWSLGEKSGNPDFAALARDWSAAASGRDVIIGVGAYKPEVVAQLPALIDSTRAAGAAGNAFFRYENISRNPEFAGRYDRPADIPPMPWKDPVPPLPPRNFQVDARGEDMFTLRWSAPPAASDGDTAKSFNVYRSASFPVDVSSGQNLIAILRGAVREFSDTLFHAAAPEYFYAVSALDKMNNESAPAVQGVVMPEIVALERRFESADRLGAVYPAVPSSVAFFPYELRAQSAVSLTVVDPEKKTVLTIVDGIQPRGRYVAAADLSSLKNGLYSCVMRAGNFAATRSIRIDH